jgi:hypothetical protein
MIARMVLGLFFVSASAGVLRADDKHPVSTHGSEKQTALEAFKKLAGDWRGKSNMGPGEGHEAHVTYKVTSGGNTVLETESPGTEHEMITAIYPDGDDLVLTHFCHLGNQPQMRASGELKGKQIAFKFVRASNLKSEKDMHMHNATFTFVDDNTLKAEWTLYQDGKPGTVVVMDLKRQK